MSAQLKLSKRQHDESLAESNGPRKWHKSTLGSENLQCRGGTPSGNIIRLLCPTSRVGGIIGKGGSIISQICKDSGAKVRFEDTVPGCDERVIVISVPYKNNEVWSEQVDTDSMETKKAPEPGDDKDKLGETDEDNKQSVPVDDSQSDKEKEISSVQKALLIVLDKVIDGFSEAKEGDKESNNPFSSVRLLVFTGQVGRLLGIAGSSIQQMSSESGAKIRILRKCELPSCASSSDDLVQISGRLDAIWKALQSVSVLLLAKYSFLRQSSHYFGPPPPRHAIFPPPNRHFHGGAPNFSGFNDVQASKVLRFRLLCSEDKVGGVIGNGGCIVRALEHETGCEIKVRDGRADSENRIVIISGLAHPSDGILSAPQDALLRVQSRIAWAAPENKEKTVIAKLLFSSNQIGCLLGKGGSVISEMRRSTGAYIRILGKNEMPKCASENEQVIQVNGEFEVVQEALLQITSKLRDHFFRDAFPPSGPPPNPAFNMGRREISPSRMFSNQGPPFNNFDGPGGLHPGGGFLSRDGHPPLAHDFIRPGIPPESERMPSAIPWGPQAPVEGAGPMGFPDYPGAPQRRIGGFAEGNQLANITSTTVDVIVPSFVVPAIYGEDGGCLEQIREISEAKITIADPKPGATETMIVIYGMPDQTRAAQSLIQAFVLSEINEAH